MSEALPYEVAPCPKCGLPIWPYSLTCGHCQAVKWTLMLRYLDPNGVEQSVENESIDYHGIAFEGEEPNYYINEFGKGYP